MHELTENAYEELKRADHLLYVSLKYTRTVDIIRSIIERLINAFDFMIERLLSHKADEINTRVPSAPAMRCEILKNIFQENEQMLNIFDFYLHLRKLMRTSYKKINEFRRHVAMICDLSGQTEEINIDVLTGFYLKTKKEIFYIEEFIREEK